MLQKLEKAAAEIQDTVTTEQAKRWTERRYIPRAGFTTNKGGGVPKGKRRMVKLSRRRNRPKRKRAA